MTLEELLAQIKASYTMEQVEARRAEIATQINTADAAQLDDLNKELDALEERSRTLALEQRRKDMSAVAGGGGTVMGAGKPEETRTLKKVLSSAEYENAYAEYIKTGDAAECRSLLTKLVDGGSLPVPTYVADRIGTAWERTNIIRRLRHVVSDGEMIFPFELSATDAVVHVEGSEAPAEEVLTFGEVKISHQTIKKWITVSDTALKLKGRAFLDYIYDEIEHKILQKADSLFIAAVKAAPAASTESAAGVPALTPTAITASTIFSALALLAGEAERPVAIMHKQTYFNDFMGLTDTTGRPIYNIVSDNGVPTYYLNGVEVIFDATLTPGKELIVGDLEGGVLLQPDSSDVTFVTDPYSLAEQNKVKIVGKMFAGLGVTRPNYFVKITVTPATGG